MERTVSHPIDSYLKRLTGCPLSLQRLSALTATRGDAANEHEPSTNEAAKRGVDSDATVVDSASKEKLSKERTAEGKPARRKSIIRPRATEEPEPPKEKKKFDVMMMLDSSKIPELQEAFENYSEEAGGLTMSNYVKVMSNILDSPTDASGIPIKEVDLAVALCDLFRQIDINGDGTMEWDEFTSFIVEMGMASHDHQPDAIQKYNYAGCKEVGKRRTSYIAQVCGVWWCGVWWCVR